MDSGQSFKNSATFWSLVATASFFKILLLNSYRSTDFEVHRNWLAITHSLPPSRWYYEERSEWTLDYPPFFAYFEWALSQIAVYFDPKMVDVNNLNYDSPRTILFQKLSVILVDLVFAYSILSVIKALQKTVPGFSKLNDVRVTYFLIVFINGGLFMIDHIHFQYNGFLYGILLLSIARILENKFFKGALLFSTLLNLKHIYLYIAPAFGTYLFRKYCVHGSGFGLRLNFKNLLNLAAAVLSTFAISFGPFYRHIPQILKRLFAFGRGLCHAYWAPNIWAVYNTVDLALNFVGNQGKKSAATGGLVGVGSLTVLPNIQPIHTFGLTLVFMLPSMYKVLRNPSQQNFLNGIILTAWTSFLFGYHVHEKAILNVIIPFSIIFWAEPKLFFLTLVSGTFSLFPLLFTPFEIIFKFLFCSLHILLTFSQLPSLKFNFLEITYLVGFFPLFIIENFGPLLVPRYPFLPLMLVSNYCFIGIFLCYLKFYWNSLTITNNSKYEFSTIKLSYSTKTTTTSTKATYYGTKEYRKRK